MAKASGRCASIAGPNVASVDGREDRTDLRSTEDSSGEGDREVLPDFLDQIPADVAIDTIGGDVA